MKRIAIVAALVLSAAAFGAALAAPSAAGRAETDPRRPTPS